MDNVEVSLYDYSKELVSNEVPMDPMIFYRRTKEVAEKISQSKSKYYCLLCRERNDYTIFNLKEMSFTSDLQKELSITLKNRGKVLLIDDAEAGGAKNAFEIWIRSDDEENFAYYLFDYTEGVIEV